MKGKKGKGNGCQSEVMPLLCLLLWQAELSSLNEFVVCSEQATSFIKNSQNTTPHLIPMISHMKADQVLKIAYSPLKLEF